SIRRSIMPSCSRSSPTNRITPWSAKWKLVSIYTIGLYDPRKWLCRRRSNIRHAYLRLRLRCMQTRVRGVPVDHGRSASQMPEVREEQAAAINRHRRRNHVQRIGLLSNRLPQRFLQEERRSRQDFIEHERNKVGK